MTPSRVGEHMLHEVFDVSCGGYWTAWMYVTQAKGRDYTHSLYNLMRRLILQAVVRRREN